MTEKDVTLGMIMDYCKEKGIQLPMDSSLATLNGNQQYGNVFAQTYFTYFAKHMEEIVNWASVKYPNSVNTNDIIK